MNNKYLPVDDGFEPFDKDAEIERHGRHLPHWKQRGVTYFVTFRLADSIPQARLRSWKRERDEWLAHHPRPWSAAEFRDYAEFFDRFETWLDSGIGSCLLTKPGAAELVSNSLKYFDGERYILDEFVVMSNHVHVLVRAGEEKDLSTHLHSWKSYTAHELNKRSKRRGTVWQDESFDHIVRSVSHLEYYRKYIRDNPRKAGISCGYAIGCGVGLKV